ncbi:protein translocase subunit SecD [Candidatus Babeliales bacterium]|nr:protein translocase subunit SecD [Candidatus Babeliales bacterium]
MSSRAVRFFTSQFMFWVGVFVIGSYFLFKIDTSVFRQNVPWSQRFAKMIKVPNINLGIDLQGGAHLVVSVEIEKAIENRLVAEGKSIGQLFKHENLKQLPEKKEFKKSSMEFSFENEDAASAAYGMVKGHMSHLKLVRKGKNVFVSLSPQESQRIRLQSVEQAVNILKRRLDTAGVQGLVVQQHGERQIVVQLPGEESVDEKKELISKTAHLEFKIVEKEAMNRDSLLDEYDGELPADKVIVPGREDSGEKYYLVSAFPDLTGDHITFAKEDFDQYGKMVVGFKLDSVGAREFGELTTNNTGKPLGVVIDNVMYSVANISEPITSGSCQISGNYTGEQARALSIVLNSGALQAPLKFEYETRVGASLGQDSIAKGLISCLVGLGLLFVFSVFYYKLAGFFAFLALLFNLFLVMLFLSWFKFALTLPGIAGMVLTIGMAVDASVLIYERIRELLAEGVTLRKAVQDGFAGAMVVILDANFTTFLTGLVLFKFGGPAIRGFAVTLMAGIVATIFAGVFFLRSIFLFLLDFTNFKCFGLKAIKNKAA